MEHGKCYVLLHLLAGLTCWSPHTPGIIPVSVIIAAFMTENIPLAASLCPIFGLT